MAGGGGGGDARGGGEAAAGEAAQAGGGGEGGLSLSSIVSPVPVALNTRRLSEHLYRKEFGEVAAAADPLGARLMAAGCGKGAGSFFSLVPMASAFRLERATFVASARRYNGLSPADLPHSHHCGNRGERQLGQPDFTHLYNCPCLGGNTRPHDSVKNTLAHAIHQCGLVSALPKTEVQMDRVGCDTWHADIMLVDDASGTSYVIDVAIVNIDSATALQRRGDEFRGVSGSGGGGEASFADPSTCHPGGEQLGGLRPLRDVFGWGLWPCCEGVLEGAVQDGACTGEVGHGDGSAGPRAGVEHDLCVDVLGRAAQRSLHCRFSGGGFAASGS